MQKKTKRKAKVIRSKAITKALKKKEKVHSFFELYLHGLAGVIGLGILVIPLFVALVYGGGRSQYILLLVQGSLLF